MNNPAIIAMMMLATVAMTAPAHADDYERAVRDAAKYSRYDVPKFMPRIFFVSESEVAKHTPVIAGHTPYGYYNDDRQALYMTMKFEELVPDPIQRHGWLVHESVHYLQDLAGLQFETCANKRMREAEAYHVQNEYLKSHNAVPVRWQASLHPCQTGD